MRLNLLRATDLDLDDVADGGVGPCSDRVDPRARRSDSPFGFMNETGVTCGSLVGEATRDRVAVPEGGTSGNFQLLDHAVERMSRENLGFRRQTAGSHSLRAL